MKQEQQQQKQQGQQQQQWQQQQRQQQQWHQKPKKNCTLCFIIIIARGFWRRFLIQMYRPIPTSCGYCLLYREDAAEPAAAAAAAAAVVESAYNFSLSHSARDFVFYRCCHQCCLRLLHLAVTPSLMQRALTTRPWTLLLFLLSTSAPDSETMQCFLYIEGSILIKTVKSSRDASSWRRPWSIRSRPWCRPDCRIVRLLQEYNYIVFLRQILQHKAALCYSVASVLRRH